MSIRAKLYFLIFLFGFALLAILVALGLLVRTATTTLTRANEVLQQQSVSVNMQAQLRDAEAALYRYEIEGETGFAIRFKDQLELFNQEVGRYEETVSSPDEKLWAEKLRRAHADAVEFGDKLIKQRNLQSEDLVSVEAIQSRTASLLSGRVIGARSNDADYQSVIHGMSISLREIPLALMSYLATPREIDRVRFMDSVSTFRSYLKQFERFATSPQEKGWVSELEAAIDDIELIGSQLISRRVQQKADYANFALLLFQAGQGIIVDEIQPQAAAEIALARAELDRTVRFSVLFTLATIVVTSVIFLSVIFPLVQRMNTSIMALVRGADSVTAGDLSTSVTVSGQDEFQRLAASFNDMTADLGAREQRLRELIQKLSLVQEEERRLIGLDLHDGLTQMLLSANMHFNAFESKFREGEGNSAEPQFMRARTRLKEAIEEARWVVSELRPTDLEDYGLVDGLHHYVNKVSESRNWDVVFESDSMTDQQLTPGAETAIFRIVQEALSNARKYANTPRIRVLLAADQSQINLQVRDWGKGFDPSKLNGATDNLGVVGMEERAKLIGGSFKIASKLGEGTVIDVQIPTEGNYVVPQLEN